MSVTSNHSPYSTARIEEGKKIRDKLQSHKKIVEDIKDQKLQTLRDSNIPAKY